jgi:hypothetical protein
VGQEVEKECLKLGHFPALSLKPNLGVVRGAYRRYPARGAEFPEIAAAPELAKRIMENYHPETTTVPAERRFGATNPH